MTMTLSGLMAADTPAIRAVADHYERLAHQIDEAVGDLGTATRDLPNYWSAGPGSAAAAAQDADLRKRLSTAYDPVNWSARVIRDFADQLDRYRQMVHSVVGEAESKGFRVDLAGGSVTGAGPLAGGAAPMAGLQAAQASAAYYAQLLGDILDQANQSDLSAQFQLSQVDPGGAELPTVPADPQLPPNATAASFAPGDPQGLADWWQRIDPLSREDLVNRYPEAVGAAVGLPSRYRDAANRILLKRRHAQLLAEQQRLDEIRDGAGSPGLQRVQMDLAATERLQKADGYVVDYVPGNEQHTQLSDGNDPKWDALWVF
ncbi:hypothetical protein ACIA5C_23935 [Actinoplanes sp. NPDC051343]|jgi:hypothetical protein|uniref:hypothetical protein n=1 Tax=Actinoplanes sp. NPDC051343 TaxID=3363906 RepID=UPI0037AA925A